MTAPPSPLTRWDPRAKLIAMLTACAVAAAVQTSWGAAIALLIALALAAIARILHFRYLRRVGLVVLALAPIVVTLLFVDGGTNLALTIVLRALAIATFAYILVATAPLECTATAARSLGLPGSFTLIVLLTIRYATLIIDEIRRLRIAWRVRAFEPVLSRQTYRTYAHGIGAVLVRSGDRGERVAAAMRTRGFDGRFHTAHPFHSHSMDWLACFALSLVMIALAVGDRLS